ncbi:MAG TPA: exodeoxyribonuclease VII small subunit [Candidatus Saccharimonadales bacterium]|nr:exodeoxyribonuclease VII small subunit [Candidatus Saccharimonadales bacterium]
MADKPTKTYRQMNEELAEILAWFESEQVDLDQAVAKYEQAMKLLASMEDYLKTAENKIKKIATKFE